MIGIITLNRDTFSNPTLITLFRELNKQKVPVIIYTGFSDQIIPDNFNFVTYHKAPSGIYIPRRPLPFLQYISIFFAMIISLRKNKIKHVIAIDPYGMVLTGRVANFFRFLNIHYFSFEIFFKDEVKLYPIVEKFKREEIKYSKKVTSILIQDEVRQNLLMSENELMALPIKWNLIPVSTSRSKYEYQKKYRKNDFGLKSTDVVYIHSGSIASWAGIDHIIKAIEKGLPKNCYILIHNRNKFNTNDPIYKRLSALKERGYPLIIHDLFFSDYDDYINFLSCFDFGIVLYQQDGGIYTGKNIQEIGLASGKLSAYMLANLPCLLSDCNAYNEILKNYKIGNVVTENIDLNHHIFNSTLNMVSKTECSRFYEDVLEPMPKIKKFIKSII